MGWRDEAACRGMGTDLFYSDGARKQAQARAVCRRCTVAVECEIAGVGEPAGIWGGQDRNLQRRRRNASKARLNLASIMTDTYPSQPKMPVLS